MECIVVELMKDCDVFIVDSFRKGFDVKLCVVFIDVDGLSDDL